MHLQENTLFENDLVGSRSNDMLPSTLYASAKFKVATSDGLEDTNTTDRRTD